MRNHLASGPDHQTHQTVINKITALRDRLCMGDNYFSSETIYFTQTNSNEPPTFEYISVNQMLPRLMSAEHFTYLQNVLQSPSPSRSPSPSVRPHVCSLDDPDCYRRVRSRSRDRLDTRVRDPARDPARDRVRSRSRDRLDTRNGDTRGRNPVRRNGDTRERDRSRARERDRSRSRSRSRDRERRNGDTRGRNYGRDRKDGEMGGGRVRRTRKQRKSRRHRHK